MLDVRYHIVYLCAVFLMLGFGILIGEHVTLPPQVTATAKSLAALQVQVDGAVQEGREAKSQLVQVERSLNSLRPKLTHGKLTGHRVVVVQYGDYPQATAAAAAALQLAGANVAATVVIEDKMDALTPTQITTILDALPADSHPPASDGAAGDSGLILTAVATILRGGSTSKPSLGHALETLQSQGLITIDGDVATPCTYFVFVGGRKIDWPDDGANPIDGALIQRLQDFTPPEAAPPAAAPPVTIIGCEPFDVGVSSIKTYQKYGLTTVDCIDRPLGQLDLPFTLRTDAGDRADYGLKTTATRQLPPVLEDQSS
ncbi:MAG: Copper transport outer membrane protein MctB [Capsulimonas sp.]|jgi:hypothetical protein|nr:Copper transport outer membrane protein MctB [Capsulimonas sp.]